MTRGSKIILSLFLAEAILLSIIVLNSLFPNPLDLERLSKIATVIGFLVALGALIVAAAEYYRKRDLDAKESRPYIIVSLLPKETEQSTFELRVENTGKTLAKNVSVKFTPDHRPFTGVKTMNELGILNNIGVITPNEYRKYFFGHYLSPEGDGFIKKEFRIKVSYTDVTGKHQYKETFIENPTDYDGMIQNTQRGLNDIYAVLQKLVKVHEGSATSQKKLQETITEKGIRIRNLHNVRMNKKEQINLIINIYKYHSENELWLNPFINDYKLMIRQCRDLILAQDILSEKDKLMVTELNHILTKNWQINSDEVETHFNNLANTMTARTLPTSTP